MESLESTKFDNAMIANQRWFAEDDGDILFASPQSNTNDADFRQGVSDARLGLVLSIGKSHAYVTGYKAHTVVMATVAKIWAVA